MSVSKSLQTVFDAEMSRSGFCEWVEGFGGNLTFQGSYMPPGLKSSMVIGSDIDAILSSSLPHGDLKSMFQEFCDKNGWEVRFRRNLVRISMGGNKKMDVLLVGDEAKIEGVYNFFWNLWDYESDGEMDSECRMQNMVHEPVVKYEGDTECIELNVNSMDKVKAMMETINGSEVAQIVFLTLKTIMKVFHVEIPTVAIMCGVIAGYNQASRNTRSESDLLQWFRNTVVNTLNILVQLVVVSNEHLLEPDTGIWTMNRMLVEDGKDYLLACGVGTLGKPYYEIITGFQIGNICMNVHKLGEILEYMGICRFDMQTYVNTKSTRGNMSLALLCFVINSVLPDVATFDMSAISDTFYDVENSEVLPEDVRKVFVELYEMEVVKNDFLDANNKMEATKTTSEMRKKLMDLLGKYFGSMQLASPADIIGGCH